MNIKRCLSGCWYPEPHTSGNSMCLRCGWDMSGNRTGSGLHNAIFDHELDTVRSLVKSAQPVPDAPRFDLIECVDVKWANGGTTPDVRNLHQILKILASAKNQHRLNLKTTYPINLWNLMGFRIGHPHLLLETARELHNHGFCLEPVRFLKYIVYMMFRESNVKPTALGPCNGTDECPHCEITVALKYAENADRPFGCRLIRYLTSIGIFNPHYKCINWTVPANHTIMDVWRMEDGYWYTAMVSSSSIYYPALGEFRSGSGWILS